MRASLARSSSSVSFAFGAVALLSILVKTFGTSRTGSRTLCWLMLPWSLAMASVFHGQLGGDAWVAISLPVVVFFVYGLRHHRILKSSNRNECAEPDA